MREIGLEVALAGVQRGQRLDLRLKAGDRTKPPAEHRLVGRIAVDRIGTDINHGGQPLRPQQLKQRIGRNGRKRVIGSNYANHRFLRL